MNMPDFQPPSWPVVPSPEPPASSDLTPARVPWPQQQASTLFLIVVALIVLAVGGVMGYVVATALGVSAEAVAYTCG